MSKPNLTTGAARIVAAVFPNSPIAAEIRAANHLSLPEKPTNPTPQQIRADHAALREKYGEKRF